jgi:hypothetical protein
MGRGLNLSSSDLDSVIIRGKTGKKNEVELLLLRKLRTF